MSKQKIENDAEKQPCTRKKFGVAVLTFLKKNEYIFSKIGLALLTLALTTICLFFLLRQIPGDVVDIYAQSLQVSRGLTYDKAYELAVQLMNYDPNEGIIDALIRYVGGLMRGELGESYLTALVAVYFFHGTVYQLLPGYRHRWLCRAAQKRNYKQNRFRIYRDYGRGARLSASIVDGHVLFVSVKNLSVTE